MSDNGTAGPLHATPHPQITSPAAESDAARAEKARRPHPVGMLVVDVVTGTVTAANPAGRRRLTGATGLQLSRWAAALATTSGPTAPHVTVLRTWTGVDEATGARTHLRAECTPVDFRSHPSLLVVLRDDAGEAAADLVPDRTRAVFTLDAVGRIDSWGPTAERLTGFVADVVIGSDTTLLHTGPARLAGEPHRALTDAYRNGEHRVEGWRVCSDGRTMWAEIVTCALHDGLDRLVGFASAMHDLTARHRLSAAAGAGYLPSPRHPAVVASARPLPSRPGGSDRPGGSRPGRVPGQRRPSNS